MKNSHLLVRLVFICIWGIISCSVLQAQSFKSHIDSIIQNEFNEPDGPGAVFMVTHRGKPIYEQAFGKSNVELGTDLSIAHVFQIGSMTKQFTAVAILLLEQQGKLSVDDPISKYIADYPNGQHITLHHVLTHTSGIHDFTSMKSINSIAQKEMSPKMLVDFFKAEPVDFAPGEKFAYNNAGYAVLGYIIEIVSGKTYAAFIKQHIFEQVGMHDSRYASDRAVITNRAYGYHKKETGYVNKTVINFSVPFSSGALMSTLSDMLKWQNALNNNMLLNNRQTEKLFRRYMLNDGSQIDYGYGWHIRTLNGLETREHGGSIFGFKTMAVYIPAADLYVIGFSNCDCHSPTYVTTAIAEFVLEQIEKNPILN